MNDVVVVIRLQSGDDLLAIMHSELDGVVKVEYPYYVRVSHSNSNVVMMPYCALSDEKYYEIKKDRIEFLVTANDDISKKFLAMLDSYEQVEAVKKQLPEETVNEVEGWFTGSYVKGTDTKH